MSKHSPLEVAGLPGSAAVNEIMRNVWVCFAALAAMLFCLTARYLDKDIRAPQASSGHDSQAARAGEPQEDGSSLGDELKKPVNGH